jgi:hypothetical protein
MKTNFVSVPVIALVGVICLAAPRQAHAQSAKASAEALFEEGRRLIGDGKLADACPKFAASEALDPSSGTLLNLANCYEKLGRNASAWAAYQEAASLASSNGRADHLQVAQKRSAGLQGSLSRVVVSVPTPVEGIEIRRDDVPVTKAEWALPIPIDPGSHTYVAAAPGYKPVTMTVVVAPTLENGKAPPSTMVTIPALEKLPPEPNHAVQPLAPVAPVPATPLPPAQPPEYWRPGRVGALIAGGVGLVGFGLATGFAVSAKGKFTSSLASCPHGPNLCSAAGVEQRNSALADGNIATATFIVGAAGAAAGAVLWFTAGSSDPREKRTTFEVSPTPGGLMMRAQW